MSMQPIVWGGVIWEVQYDYSAAVPGRMYLRNGDPGDPPESEEITINEVYVENSTDNILEFLSDGTLENLEAQISELESLSRSTGEL